MAAPRAKWRYTVYGLTIESSEPIGGLVQAAQHATPEISIEFGAEPEWLAEPFVGERYRATEGSEADRVVVNECTSGFLFRYGDGTAFDVSRDARRIWCRFEAPYVLADAVVYLLGPILGFALRLRGVLCLHASAVVVDGRAVALAGPAGAGKSTTAGCFAKQGYTVLSDDLVALHMANGAWMVRPAYGQLRLWSEGERLLFGASGRLPRLTPTWDKRALELEAEGFAFGQTPAPLGAVVFLPESDGAGAPPGLRPLSGRAAVLAIVGETYCNYLLDAAMRREELAALTSLVETIPVWEVTAPDDDARPAQIVSAVLRELGASA